MKKTVLSIIITVWCCAATGQGVQPVVRYNSVAESMYLLQRCGALTSERRAWIENVREHAIRANGWDAVQLATHDKVLKAELDQRYTTVPKERCDQLAQATDLEIKQTRKAP